MAAAEITNVEVVNLAPVCRARAVLAATVVVKDPPETVYEEPEQLVPLIGPVYTLQ